MGCSPESQTSKRPHLLADTNNSNDSEDSEEKISHQENDTDSESSSIEEEFERILSEYFPYLKNSLKQFRESSGETISLDANSLLLLLAVVILLKHSSEIALAAQSSYLDNVISKLPTLIPLDIFVKNEGEATDESKVAGEQPIVSDNLLDSTTPNKLAQTDLPLLVQEAINIQWNELIYQLEETNEPVSNVHQFSSEFDFSLIFDNPIDGQKNSSDQEEKSSNLENEQIDKKDNYLIHRNEFQSPSLFLVGISESVIEFSSRPSVSAETNTFSRNPTAQSKSTAIAQSNSGDAIASAKSTSIAQSRSGNAIASAESTAIAKSNSGSATAQSKSTAIAQSNSGDAIASAKSTSIAQSRSGNAIASAESTAIAKSNSGSATAQSKSTAIAQSNSGDAIASAKSTSIAQSRSGNAIASAESTAIAKSNSGSATAQSKSTAIAQSNSGDAIASAKSTSIAQSRSGNAIASAESTAIAKSNSGSATAFTEVFTQSDSGNMGISIQSKAFAQSSESSAIAYAESNLVTSIGSSSSLAPANIGDLTRINDILSSTTAAYGLNALNLSPFPNSPDINIF